MNIKVTIKLEMAQEHCNYGCDALVVAEDGKDYCAIYGASEPNAFDTQRNLPLRCTECIERHGVTP